MGRLVSAAIRGTSETSLPIATLSAVSVHALNADLPAPQKPQSSEGDDNYAERIAKYVPAEVIAFFVTADSLFPDPNDTIPSACGSIINMHCFISNPNILPAIVVFVIGLVATPLYVWRMRDDGEPWGIHAIMATIAFVVWAYGMHAHIFVGTLYSAAWRTFFILLFSLASGFIVPTKSAPASGGT